MKQRRTDTVMVLLEPDLAKLMDKAREHIDISRSTYFRKLLIDDLKERELLSDQQLLSITEG